MSNTKLLHERRGIEENSVARVQLPYQYKFLRDKNFFPTQSSISRLCLIVINVEFMV